MNVPGYSNRRNVLKTMGVGLVGSTVLTGTAAAQQDDGEETANGEQQDDREGTTIGEFLTEEAMFKDSPIWDTGIEDRTGEDEVEVQFDALTDINIPDPDAPDVGPWGVEPRAVLVSTGTDVTWTWREEWEEGHEDEDDGLPPHYLASYFDPPEWGDEFFEYPGPGGEFTYEFADPGTYLYFCVPHGTPFALEDEDEEEDPPEEAPEEPLEEIKPEEVDEELEEPEEVRNLFGQRGAVIVTRRC